MTTQPKKQGGDRSQAALRNGKKVGPRPKDPILLARQVKLTLRADDDNTLAAFARLEGITRQDLIRRILREWMADRQII